MQNQAAHSRRPCSLQTQHHELRTINCTKIIKGSLWESILLIALGWSTVEVQSVVVESWTINPKKVENHKGSLLTIVSLRMGRMEKSEWTMLGRLKMSSLLWCVIGAAEMRLLPKQQSADYPEYQSRSLCVSVCVYVCVYFYTFINCQHMEH